MSRSRGASSFTRSPPMISSPSEMSSRPAIIRSAVDFPQPDGPTRIMNSPSPISRSMFFTASNPSGYRFQTWFSVISAMTSPPVVQLRLSGRPRRDVARIVSYGSSRRPCDGLGVSSSLHRPRGQTGHDPLLEQQDQQDQRDRDDDR